MMAVILFVRRIRLGIELPNFLHFIKDSTTVPVVVVEL